MKNQVTQGFLGSRSSGFVESGKLRKFGLLREIYRVM